MDTSNEWRSVITEPPPQETAVDTKIDDKDGVRNVQPLMLKGRLWWFIDGSMYVYYVPTHWKNHQQ